MNAQPVSIPIIVDVPRADPGLGFERYVSAITAAILGGSPAQYTVGLYGRWGTGKSSILLALEEALKASSSRARVVTFDAWRHERVPNLLGPLVYTIKQAFGASERKVDWDKIFGGLEVSAFGVGVRVPSRADRADQVDLVREYMDSIYALSRLGGDLKDGERLVVLIDDLDRCSPDRVIEVIESIRMLMDVPGFVFVLAIDYEVLIEAVRNRYPHADPHRFIEKIVQVPFRIPATDPDAQEFMTQLVADWDALRKVWFAEFEDAEIRSIIRIALRDNPRQIKRLLNSFMVGRHIEWTSMAEVPNKARMLLASLAMQLRWPVEFEQLTNAIEFYLRENAGKEIEPVLAAIDLHQQWSTGSNGESPTDPDLQAFLSRHLHGSLPLSSLDDAMRLASDLSATDGEQVAPEDARRLFIDRVLGLLRALSDSYSVELDPVSGVGSLSAEDEVKVVVEDMRSVPKTFSVRVRGEIPHAFHFQTVTKVVRDGDWTRIHFGYGAGETLNDVLADAAQLIEAYTAGLS